MTDKICSFDEAYTIYDAEEIGWCENCKCDKDCLMYQKRHIHTIKTEKIKNIWYIRKKEVIK